MSTSWVVDDLVDEASELFDGPLDGLVAVLEEIASLGDVEAPTPSAELALLLAGRPAETRRPVRRSHRRLAPVLGGLAAAAVTGLTLTGTAAYANELPPSMQRVVAHLSEDYLPFTFPRPVGDPPAPHHASPRGTGARSSGGATPGTDPSAVAKSGAVPVVPSTSGGPTARADERLVRQDVSKPRPPARSAAQHPVPHPAPTPSADDRFAATTTDAGTDAPAVVPSPSPSPEPSADTASPTTSPVDPQASPSGVGVVPTPVPSTTPGTDPSFSAPASDPSTPQSTTPAGSQLGTTPGSGTPSTGLDATNGKTASPAAGPDPSLAAPTTTTPPGAPTDPGGSQPAGQASSSPDTSTSSPAVGSEGGPTSAVVADPSTEETSASITPSP
jgi:hypothetical protein